MKILYIDNKKYIHNADLHIDFIASLEKNNFCKIIGYGNFLSKRLKTSIIPNFKNINNQIDKILKIYNIDAILTYNSGGSNYGSGGDNISLYNWISDKISKINIPKFHITTDYLRCGFRQSQADWFEDLGYTAAIFRTKDSMRHSIGVRKILLPFSVDKNLYLKNINKKEKENKVGFIGTSNKFPEIYINRIMAMKALRDNHLLVETKYLKTVGRSQMMFGEHYVKFLTKNLFNLTCAGTCNYFTAKHFQIPAAYSMLVCTDVSGLEDFPENTYIKYNIDNLEKLIDDIIYHIENKKITFNKIDTLHNYIINNHTNYTRGREFIKKLETLV
tara:strand:+ start:1178 stop:2170 length:993 start_codon:yes stop_codon:yes gene_type:complete